MPKTMETRMCFGINTEILSKYPSSSGGIVEQIETNVSAVTLLSVDTSG